MKVTFTKHGDWYDAYGKEARWANAVLGYTLAVTENHTWNLRIPTFAADQTFDRLNARGFDVLIMNDLDKTILDIVKPPRRRHKAPEGECSTCDNERKRNNSFHPPHDAGSNCESGKHSHCSCDWCF